MKNKKKNKKRYMEKEVNNNDVQNVSAEEVLNEQQTEESTSTAEPEQAEVEAIDDKQKQIEELQQKCADLADKNLRMMAEFDNYRRRTSKEKLELQKNAGEKIFVDMLPLIDDFERAIKALNQTTDIDSLRQGVELIYNKFISFLNKQEVQPINTENADFDTAFHEAITTFPAPTPELKGKVIDCTQKGYTLAGKVIRYAKVVVGE